MHTPARRRAQLTLSDHEIAEWIADALLDESASRGRYILSVLHDKTTGPFLFPFTHKQKNRYEFVTTDQVEARRWIFQVALAGYTPLRTFRLHWGGSGPGSIADVRKRLAERVRR